MRYIHKVKIACYVKQWKQEISRGNEKCGRNLFRNSVEALEDEVNTVFQKLESKGEIESIRKLDDKSNRVKNQCLGVPRRGNTKMYDIKIFLNNNTRKIPQTKENSLQIERSTEKQAQNMKKRPFQGPHCKIAKCQGKRN